VDRGASLMFWARRIARVVRCGLLIVATAVDSAGESFNSALAEATCPAPGWALALRGPPQGDRFPTCRLAQSTGQRLKNIPPKNGGLGRAVTHG
jgi:hypothetical protein